VLAVSSFLCSTDEHYLRFYPSCRLLTNPISFASCSLHLSFAGPTTWGFRSKIPMTYFLGSAHSAFMVVDCVTIHDRIRDAGHRASSALDSLLCSDICRMVLITQIDPCVNHQTFVHINFPVLTISQIIQLPQRKSTS
jgi:hypothetical protein